MIHVYMDPKAALLHKHARSAWACWSNVASPHVLTLTALLAGRLPHNVMAPLIFTLREFAAVALTSRVSHFVDECSVACELTYGINSILLIQFEPISTKIAGLQWRRPSGYTE